MLGSHAEGCPERGTSSASAAAQSPLRSPLDGILPVRDGILEDVEHHDGIYMADADDDCEDLDDNDESCRCCVGAKVDPGTRPVAVRPVCFMRALARLSFFLAFSFLLPARAHYGIRPRRPHFL